MGLYRKDYIVYGYKLPYNMTNDRGEKINFFDDKFLPYIEGWKGEEYSIIRDETSGGYTVFGLGLYRNNSDNGWNFQQLNLTENIDPQKVKNKFKELFGVEILTDATVFIFSIFS